jgi:hypothetical protein
LYVTCEREPQSDEEDVALEWETSLGFCFRLSRRTACVMMEHLGTALIEHK